MERRLGISGVIKVHRQALSPCRESTLECRERLSRFMGCLLELREPQLKSMERLSELQS